MQKAEFVQCVRNCERRLYRIAYTMLRNNADCEDAVQEALLKAWNKLNSLREERYFETWLIRILINECRNIWRRRRDRETELTDQIAAPDDGENLLYPALMGMKSTYRTAMELHYIEGYKLKEIAHMLSVPETTVKWRLSKGRSELKKQLGEEALL